MRPASDTATRKVDKEAMFTARRDVSPLLGGVKATPLARAQEVGCVPHPTLARQNLTSQLSRRFLAVQCLILVELCHHKSAIVPSTQEQRMKLTRQAAVAALTAACAHSVHADTIVLSE